MGKKRVRKQDDSLGEAAPASPLTGFEKLRRPLKRQRGSPESSKNTPHPSRRTGEKQPKKNDSAGAASPSLNEQHDASPAVDMSIIHGLSNPGTDSKDARRFPYRQLNAGFLEIRVLTLMPGLKGSPVICEIEHVRADRISSEPEKGYSALSYTWGSPDETGVMQLQGVAIQVRQNLLQALIHLRCASISRRLWVDAICINQNDIRERSKQVSIMGKIYQLANEVVVWLGRGKDNSKSAISFIKAHVSFQGKALLSDLLASPNHAAPFQAILSLTQRDYWQRAWIIQEVFQARKITIHCGFDTLPWPHLAKFFRLLEQRVDNFENVGRAKEICNTTAHRLTKDRTSKNRDLYHLLHRYQDSMCSESRDRVFSLCGMSKEYVGIVDYSKSPEDLFRLLCAFDNNVPMVWHRIRIAQAIQKAPDLSPSDTWAREGVSHTKYDTSLICRYSHHNKVANISPEFPMEEATLNQWYSYFKGPNMPSLESVKKTLGDLTVHDLRLLKMKEPSGHEPNLGMNAELLEDSLVLRQMLYSPSLPNTFSGLRLFTTHNGRVGITLRPLHIAAGTTRQERWSWIARFADCDVALVVSNDVQYTGIVMSRVFFIKDDKDGLRPGHSAYRFAVPDSRDTHRACSSIQDGDVGEGRRDDIVVRERDTLGSIKCTLGQLQFWTAAHAPSKKYWEGRR